MPPPQIVKATEFIEADVWTVDGFKHSYFKGLTQLTQLYSQCVRWIRLVICWWPNEGTQLQLSQDLPVSTCVNSHYTTFTFS